MAVHAGDLPKAWVARAAVMARAGRQVGAHGPKHAQSQVSLHGG